MKLLVVAATEAEILPLLKHFELSGTGLIMRQNFDVLITGVGMTATAFALGQHLNNTYNLVLNLGIAGSFDRSIALGTVLNIREDVLSELGAQDNGSFLSIEALGFGKSVFSGIAHPVLQSVKGITVNTVHGNTESIKKVKDATGAQTESMEGAAVFYCCEQKAIDCLQVRSISNYVEPRNKNNRKLGLAIANLNKWAIEFLNSTVVI